MTFKDLQLAANECLAKAFAGGKPAVPPEILQAAVAIALANDDTQDVQPSPR